MKLNVRSFVWFGMRCYLPMVLPMLFFECVSCHVFVFCMLRSFGVTAWEVYTYGAIPYEQFGALQVIEEITGGRKLAQPLYCPDAAFRLMLQTWCFKPTNRPSFASLFSELEDIRYRLRHGREDADLRCSPAFHMLVSTRSSVSSGSDGTKRTSYTEQFGEYMSVTPLPELVEEPLEEQVLSPAQISRFSFESEPGYSAHDEYLEAFDLMPVCEDGTVRYTATYVDIDAKGFGNIARPVPVAPQRPSQQNFYQTVDISHDRP
eukprot:m.20506 g.20506  ORF g.20506 m.20506 type:complete len:262 (+) comp8181_c0_seq1:4661-5446(+)